MTMELQSIANRFWRKVDKRGPDDCWLWKGATQAGFGIALVSGRPQPSRMLAHRYVAKLSGLLTDPLDKVKHSCGVRLCCNPAHLYLKITPVELFPVSMYTTGQGPNKPPAYEADAFQRHLLPLRSGHSVVMSMTDPALARRANYRGQVEKLVIVAPGQLHGMSSDCIFVSIVGKGAAMVDMRRSLAQNVANLVLAGMPSRLANYLMNSIHLTLKE